MLNPAPSLGSRPRPEAPIWPAPLHPLHIDLFDILRHVMDPEHPYSLEDLDVLREEDVWSAEEEVRIRFCPTVTRCSLAAHIGLCLRECARRVVPRECKIRVTVYPGTHEDEENLNKQLNDRERVAAAMEQEEVRKLVELCLRNCDV